MMRPFLSDKNTVSLQIAQKKTTELYLMTLICLQSLALSLKILLSRSMSSQSLINCVPCVPKMCSRANLPYVLTSSRANVPCVLTCYVPTCLVCLCANVLCVLCVLTCERALRAYVLVCKHATFNNVNSYIIQIY